MNKQVIQSVDVTQYVHILVKAEEFTDKPTPEDSI